jgi:hypothetical protein
VVKVVLFLLAALLIAPPAWARGTTSRAEKSASSSAKKKKKKKAKKRAKHRTTRKVAKSSGKSRLNMPKGWEWPPSAAMRAEGEACLERLTALGVEWKRAEVTNKVTTPIIVPDMTLGGVKLESIWRKGPFVMDCVLALAFAETGGPALANVGVAKLRFAGIHDYREVAGKRGVLSRHALGLAMDVYEIVDTDGTTHVVLKDYPLGDELLPVVEAAARGTGAFRTVLTPGNDPKHHYDHFHFEAKTGLEQYWGPEVESRGR